MKKIEENWRKCYYCEGVLIGKKHQKIGTYQICRTCIEKCKGDESQLLLTLHKVFHLEHSNKKFKIDQLYPQAEFIRRSSHA